MGEGQCDNMTGLICHGDELDPILPEHDPYMSHSLVKGGLMHLHDHYLLQDTYVSSLEMLGTTQLNFTCRSHTI